MGNYTGWVEELLLEPYQNASARIRLPGEALPRPGQYLQAHNPDDSDEVLPTSLFPAAAPKFDRRSAEYLLPISGPLPQEWDHETELHLRGPLGRGFAPPKRLKRLALAALAGSPSRLLPLLHQALELHAEVALYTDTSRANLPLEVEVQPLGSLPDGLAWADFLALDLEAEQVEDLPNLLGRQRLPSGQALVVIPMPCGALAACGICTVPTRKGPRLACEAGPVFGLADLME